MWTWCNYMCGGDKIYRCDASDQTCKEICEEIEVGLLKSHRIIFSCLVPLTHITQPLVVRNNVSRRVRMMPPASTISSGCIFIYLIFLLIFRSNYRFSWRLALILNKEESRRTEGHNEPSFLWLSCAWISRFLLFPRIYISLDLFKMFWTPSW